MCEDPLLPLPSPATAAVIIDRFWDPQQILVQSILLQLRLDSRERKGRKKEKTVLRNAVRCTLKREVGE